MEGCIKSSGEKALNGILCVNKPQEITSFACCSAFKRLLGTKKIGHGGTLDPMATGVLPLLIGRATKALDLLPISDKEYVASLQFGCYSNTGDIWGDEIFTVEPRPGELTAYPELSSIEKTLDSFRGEIMQVPPMVSALKKDGVRLYELARQGIEVEREPRPIKIYELDILDYSRAAGSLSFRCKCSAGTYIRTICTDLGDVFSRGAVMTSLNRTMSHGFSIGQCVDFEEAKGLSYDELCQYIIPVEKAFAVYPALEISPAQSVRFCNGGALDVLRIKWIESGAVALDGNVFRIYGDIYGCDDVFLGLGVVKDGSLWVKKLLM